MIYISILVLLCTTNTSGGRRVKVGERRRASDLDVHSNTAVPAVVSTFFRYIDRIYKGASRRAALAARRFARRLHAMSSAVVVFAI